MSTQEQALAVRRGAGLFRHGDRGLISVTGGDRTRWLQGMLSNDVAALAPGPEASGCYAALLTPKGKIVADLQVLLRAGAFWLDLAAEAVEGVSHRLERYIIADDVTLTDVSQSYGRLGIEGPNAGEILTAAGVEGLPSQADAVVDASVGGVEAAIARYGWTGEEAFQLFVAKGAEQSVASELLSAGESQGIVAASAEVMDILRIEAGVPRLGRELSEDVLPDEAHLARAISLTKGCYTGQEILARLQSRGQVNHLLVGLEFPDAGAPPELGAEIWADPTDGGGRGRPIGAVTSVCQSPKAGRIALAFVRRAQAEPGTSVRLGDQRARVVELPFEAAGVARDGPRASSAAPSES